MKNVKYVKSCGFIVFKIINGSFYYLLIQSKNNDIGFPKGHMENSETEIMTAIRELKEETNLSVEIIEGFRQQIEYKLSNFIDTIKQSIYFLGKCLNDEIVCQESEVVNAEFVSFNDAMNKLTFKETKQILLLANKK